ncbi:MAG: rod shape-determining protein MreC [Candidatus Binatia bacterium]|nr:rod shape-determining protein MreC [Candidatus Binatia bacterium]
MSRHLREWGGIEVHAVAGAERWAAWARVMWEFLQRNRIGLTATVLMAISLLLLTSSIRQYRSDPLAYLVLESLRPLQGAIATGWVAVRNIWQQYVDLVGVRQENERLRQRVAELEHQNLRIAEILETDRRLAELLRFRTNFLGDAQAAMIIGRDTFPAFGTVTISKGEADGVKRGMPVVSPQGVVGRILMTSAHSARVLLITDHNSGVDALVQRTRARGIVEGSPEGRCSMKYLRREEDVAVGDKIITSGLDGVFPKGLLIGEVTHVTRGTRGLLQVAEVRPAAPLDRLEEVLILNPGTRLKAESKELYGDGAAPRS